MDQNLTCPVTNYFTISLLKVVLGAAGAVCGPRHDGAYPGAGLDEARLQDPLMLHRLVWSHALHWVPSGQQRTDSQKGEMFLHRSTSTKQQ